MVWKGDFSRHGRSGMMKKLCISEARLVFLYFL